MADPSSSVPNADSDLEAGVPTTTTTAPAAAPAPTLAAAADRVIPADEEEEEAGAEEQKGKEKGKKDISLRSSEYDGRAISLPPAAGGDGEGEGEGVGPEGPQQQHVGGVQLPHPGLYEEDEDEDPLMVKTREACLAVLRKVGGFGNVFVAIIYKIPTYLDLNQPRTPLPNQAFYIVVPLSLVACIFACLYGWVFVNTQRYLAEADSWQRCIVYNDSKPGATPQNFAVRSVSAWLGSSGLRL